MLATQAHASKAYHQRFGKAATKSNLSKANNNRDYKIFEDFAYHIVQEARECREIDIFKLGGHVYAFDSTTIVLCLNVFQWALFRKRKGGIKVHTLYDIEDIIIQKMCGNIIIPINEIQEVSPKKHIASDIRTCGISGLFGHIGWFLNKQIGRYFALVKDRDAMLTIRVISCQNHL